MTIPNDHSAGSHLSQANELSLEEVPFHMWIRYLFGQTSLSELYLGLQLPKKLEPDTFLGRVALELRKPSRRQVFDRIYRARRRLVSNDGKNLELQRKLPREYTKRMLN
ncbi:hypothetical protein OC846_006753 [Tilletia horrida]|uniref:Uncharacterized protein n=1 Tax=Tilletia horrida TaxID=155126 RepID=A0AAN6JP34_9BASI|nr:hypothetical protein OC846_006753 [Tilletia horrida]